MAAARSPFSFLHSTGTNGRKGRKGKKGIKATPGKHATEQLHTVDNITPRDKCHSPARATLRSIVRKGYGK